MTTERRENFMAAGRANLKDGDLHVFEGMLDRGAEDDVLIGFIWNTTEMYEFDERERDDPGWQDRL